MSNEMLLWIVLLAVAVAIVCLILLLLRKPDAAMARLRDQLEAALRDEQRGGRGELRDSLEALGRGQSQHHAGLDQKVNALTERTDRRLDEFRLSLAEEAHKTRAAALEQQKVFADSLGQRLSELTQGNEQRMGELRHSLETQLKALQADNAQKLEKMRETVDEKLQSTLETRFNASFGMISERLESVQRGLGEMQQLASDVGSLQRVLTNVKQRGTFGETQLGALLEDVLTMDQYAANVATLPGSAERVEFAIRMPGPKDSGQIWLPIDAKFPREDYERLVEAQEKADVDGAHAAGAALERRLRDEAKKIREKYVGPPHTTDFALLFLPTEGLYAEAIRRPGLFEDIQRTHRITLVGPTTLLAVLNALQMGFRTLAIEKRSSEVWQTLGQVKTEFGKFGATLDAVKKKLTEASNKIDETGVRSRVLERKLRDVEALPYPEDAAELQLPAADDDA
ncbi:DNA recombination protein RmuC [Lysobacter soyae]|uniref:DNA recombination protein RmuC n=1 Tax=Lysobacter soyae TaxID=2764185 RepID=A0ABX8WQL1_9GAMM|nr:DNA recombination protein RmuC [Lysobacter sp. CJ11]QYR53119.1 DNA recombination protein RmuC [Lysobacter sp. CJ11]